MESSPVVSLFIPCLVDQVYPEMGIAMTQVLRALGYCVEYDSRQSCCGQPAFNAGHWSEAKTVARHCLQIFQGKEIIVSPSGSCTAMVRKFYQQLFSGEPVSIPAIYEFSEFLCMRGDTAKISGNFSGRVGFHYSCHSYRELRLKQEPFEILRKISGCELIELPGEPICCGFGGLFSIKFPAIAGAMAEARLNQFLEKNIDTIVSNDPGCIMQLRQEVKERRLTLAILHLTEFLSKAMKL